MNMLMTLDDLAIPVMLIIVGALRLVPQLYGGGPWGAESSLAAIFFGFGVLGLLAEVLRRPEAIL